MARIERLEDIEVGHLHYLRKSDFKGQEFR
jgi:hypothetical protein